VTGDNGADDQQELEPVERDATNFWNEDVVWPTDVKNQHYVPRMFLRGFAGADGRVRRVDLEMGRTVRRSTKSIGSGPSFNNFEIEGVEVSTEDWLGDLENRAAPLLKRLIEDPTELLAFTGEEQMHLARFLGAFRFRVPAFRAQIASLRQQMVAFGKKMVQSRLQNDFKDDPSQATLIWEEWEQQPDDWWLGHDRPFDAAELTAAMLKEIQGYANMLWSMPWRIGRVPGQLRLYTSDNPLGGYLQPIRPWWEKGAFASMFYYVPLSPSVLLRVAPREHEAPIGEPGRRVVCPASGWDAAMAMYIQSAGATRYLFGDGPFPGIEEAMRALADYEVAAITACKVWLNWSGDEPPTMDLPGGRKGTPALVTPVQQKMAEMRKRIHERTRRPPVGLVAPLRGCKQHPI
jgi:hypothetical protein